MALLGLGLLAACTPAEPPDGLVVDELESWGTAARAGALPGDVLTGWAREDSDGEAPPTLHPLRTPLDLLRVEIEESPRAPVVLHAVRAGRRLELRPDAGEWEISTRPPLSPSELEREDEAAALAAGGDLAAAGGLRDELAAQALGEERRLDAAWFLLRQADAIAANDEIAAQAGVEGTPWNEHYERARELLPDPDLRATAWHHQCLSLVGAARAVAAEAACRTAADRRAAIDPEAPAVAASLVQLSRSIYRQRRFDVDELPARALEIYERYPRTGIERSRALYIRGAIGWGRREIEDATAWYREALRLREEVGVANPWRANLLANLGNAKMTEGDLGAAEELFQDSLAMNEEIDPQSIDTAYSLNLVGVVARRQGNYEPARLYIERALAIFERELPNGLETAGMHNNLGNIALVQGELATAERSHRKALELRRKIQPGTLNLAASLNNLGSALRRRGQTAEARELLQEALAIKEEQVPNSQDVSSTVTELAWLAQAEGDLEEAQRLHQRALELRRKFGDGTWEWVQNLFELGEIARREGRTDEAERAWREAVAAIETQRRRLGPDALVGALFAARFQQSYRSLAELLVARGELAEAFDLLESARAQALRSLLAERRVAPEGAVPSELQRERRRLDRSAQVILWRLGRLDAEGDLRAGDDLRDQLREVRARQREIDEEITRRAPRFAALRAVPPVRLAQVRRALDAESVLLSYSTGPTSTTLFVVRPEATDGPPIEAHRIATSRSELASRVEIFRALIHRGQRGGAADPALVEQGRRLFDLLLAPAAPAIAEAKRIAIVPDGPLAILPFAALVDPAAAAEQPPAFLAAHKALAFTASGGVLAELAAESAADEAAAGAESPLLVFADTTGHAAAGRAATDPALPPLPWARREAEQIAALFPAARVWTGSEATEERLLAGLEALSPAAAPGSLRLHFAVHGLLDDRFPLDSALVLAATGEAAADDPRGGESDGLLHGWEIIERLRLDADLVTLSACESGLGSEVDGEGIIGLARAFQIAGARSLMVTDWTVPDRGTAELMTRFYGHLQQGMGKAEALARAQAELAAGAAGSELGHPFHWAGVRLLGAPG